MISGPTKSSLVSRERSFFPTGVQRLGQTEQRDHKQTELHIRRDRETGSPPQVLRREAPNQRRKMRAVGKEEGEDAHEKPSLVQEIQIADGCGPNGDDGTRTDAREGARDHDAAPGGAVAGNQVRHRGQEVAAQVDGPAAIDVGEGDDEEGTYAGEDDL